MKHSLYVRFILAYLIFGLLCFGTVALFSARLSYRINLTQTADRIYTQARKIASDYSDVYRDGRLPTDFRNQLSGAGRYSDLRIWFVGIDGLISYDSSGTLTDEMIPDFDPADSRGIYRTGNFYQMFSRDMLSVQAPITADFRTYGYVIVHTPLDNVSNVSDSMLLPLYITVAIVYAVSLLILLLIHLWVMKPLREITRAAGEYASGNLKHTIRLSQNDEIGYLADTLNLMAGELSTAEDYQKKFIANVSHDFRSPLTSIKGYLNAIIDGVIPQENQERYLRVVIHETERLENLTQSMLSLNSLDRQNMHLEYSDFDICHLIRDVCATFEGKCSARGISFDLILDASSIYVHADMGKIQQVLYNLTDNAIKFSNPDSDITISVSREREKAFISVKDTGIGIAKEDIKQIWTRFFKSDTSRGKDKKGTGLGLSIVKEIITSHGETIDVISTEGAGTTFTFRLPLVKESFSSPLIN